MPTIHVSIEATTSTIVTTHLTGTTTTLTTVITTTQLGPHSNTNFRLYISRNIYSKSISIKEIYPFLI